MGDISDIEWTDSTWNPVRGCTRVSEGCRHCYAEAIAARFSDFGSPYHGYAERGRIHSKWTGKVKLMPSEILDRPLHWRAPRRVFVNSMSDLFHEELGDSEIDLVFAVMALSPNHTFQILTKRAERMLAYMTERWQPALAQTMLTGAPDELAIAAETVGEDRSDQVRRACEQIIDRRGMANTTNEALWTGEGELKCMQWTWPLPNVHLGVSAEDQKHADLRIPLLIKTSAILHMVSFEPLLGPIDISEHLWGLPGSEACASCPKDEYCECGWKTRSENDRPHVGWAIVGGESGPDARPMEPRWAHDLRIQCRSAGVPFFMKQMGGPVKSKMPPIPKGLFIREFPL